MTGADVSERVLGRESLWLAGGSLVNGLAAFLFISLGTHTYGAAGFAPASVVWSIWSVAAAVLTFPMQHWTIRQVRRGEPLEVVHATYARLGAWALVVGVVVAVASGLLGERLLRTSALAGPLTVAVLIGAAVPIGYVGGRLVAAGRHARASVLIGGDNVVRLVVASVFTLIGVSSSWFVAALAFGPVVLLIWPAVVVPSTRVEADGVRDVVELSGANSLAQLALAGGPIVVAALGAPDRTVSALFATLALARAPYLVLLGASLRLTSVWSRPTSKAPARGQVGGLTAAAACVAGLVGAAVGPWVVALLFGRDTVLSGVATGWIAAGATLALGTLVLTSNLTATGRTRQLVRAWLIAIGVGALGLLVPGNAITRTITWFVVTEGVAVAVLSVDATPR